MSRLVCSRSFWFSFFIPWLLSMQLCSNFSSDETILTKNIQSLSVCLDLCTVPLS